MTDGKATKEGALAALRDARDKSTRDARVIDAIRVGAGLDEAGFAAGVTRERIRQLVRERAAYVAYEPRDVLADVFAVCRDTETTVRLAELPQRLRALAPDHPPYWSGMGLLGTRLGEQLSGEGVRVIRHDGRPASLNVVSVRRVLAHRVRTISG